MEPVSKGEAYNLIVNYINLRGAKYKNWYAGIASDPEERLFTDHKVHQSDDYWICVPCINTDDARAVEDALHELGCTGGGRGGDEDTYYVYAYLEFSYTIR